VELIPPFALYAFMSFVAKIIPFYLNVLHAVRFMNYINLLPTAAHDVIYMISLKKNLNTT
jgi:hypothetical protein